MTYCPATSEALQHRQALLAKATAGDANAQCTMGDLCRTGDEFTQQDYSEAVRWYRLAAEQGEAAAQNNLGAMYDNAMGVPEDMAEAARWYRHSAEQGWDMAQFNLGVLYRDGKGVPKDAMEAAKWFRLAAAQGLAMAQYDLALLVGFGRGVPMDEAEATALLRSAAAQAHLPACNLLGTLYRYGDGVPKRIPLAAEFHVIAAIEGDQDARAALAEYRTEIEAEALKGSSLAALCLAKMYDYGLGVEKDQTKMFAWLTWGLRCPGRDDETDVRDELDDRRSFYATFLSDADKATVKLLVKEMRAAHPSRGTAPGKVRRKKSAATNKIVEGR